MYQNAWQWRKKNKFPRVMKGLYLQVLVDICNIWNNDFFTVFFIEFLYDTVTVGAPTAYALKYKHGGLKRMMKACEESSRKPR